MDVDMAILTKDDILRGLDKINQKAKEAGIIVDIAIYGGAALALSFDTSRTTRDVDAVVRGNPDFLRMVVKEAAEEEGWPEDWLNDGVKGFLSGSEKMKVFDEIDASSDGGLRIYMPEPEYIFAMKCMAMRPEGFDGSHDISDIEKLAKEIGIDSIDQALAIVEDFYPSAKIPAKVRFGVEEIMERVLLGKDEAEEDSQILGAK